MLKSNRTAWAGASILGLVDLSTIHNTYKMAAYFEPRLFALLAACALIGLQIGSLILSGMPLPASTRRWLLCGTAILFFVTGFSNVAESYLHGHAVFPAQTLLPAFSLGGTAQSLSVAAAWIFGLALVVVGLIFWGAFSEFLRREQEQSQVALRAVDEMLSKQRN